ncbi:MAG: response regulator [Thermodesulfobacteriota bacterium]|nr:response regulator [Thermodesulfobacteriota bacterium]
MTEETQKNHFLLLVDDEPQVLNSLQRLLRKEKHYIVQTAGSGQEGLERLKKMETPVSLIISDQRMPGMNGSEFLEQAKQIYPDAIRFMLTGYSDLNAIVDAVNKGEIHRYITKPWNDGDLKLQIRQAIQQYDLVEENRRLQAVTKEQNVKLYKLGRSLEKKIQARTEELTEKSEKLARLNKELELNLHNTIRAFAALIDMSFPEISGHGQRVSVFAKDMAIWFDMPAAEVKNVEIAGLLHDIGKIGLPKSLINKSEKNMDPAILSLYKKHPETGQDILTFIQGFEAISQLIRHHHERFDGMGYPDGLAEDTIPLGARILAVSDTYDKIMNSGEEKGRYISLYLKSRDIASPDLSQDELLSQAAMHHLKSNAFSVFDPDVVKAAIEVLKEKGDGGPIKERVLDVSSLVQGMTITRTLYTDSGRFLLPYHTVLTEAAIVKLNTIHANDPISRIYVEKK